MSKKTNFLFISSHLQVTIGVVVLIGWYLDITLFKSISPRLIAMNPLTAVCLIAGGLWLRLANEERKSRIKQHISTLLSLLLFTAGCAKLLDITFGTAIGIDQFLFAGKLGSNQIAPTTAVTFFCTGLAMLLAVERSKQAARLSDVLLCCALLISVFSLCRYIINDRSIYTTRPFVPMALHTSITFSLLSTSILLIRSSFSFIRHFSSKGLGGSMARNILPFAFVVPVAFAFLRLKGEELNFYDTSFGVCLMAVSTIVIFVFLLWKNAKSLNALDEAKKAVVEDLEKQRRELKASVTELHEKSQLLNGILTNLPVVAYKIDGDGIITESVGAGLKLLGLKDRQMVGVNVFNAYPGHREKVRLTLKNGFHVYETDGEYQGNKWTCETYMFPDEMHPGGVVCFVIDITDKKKVERKLIDAKESAETASEFKSKFLASMSHELRTPLNAVIGFSKILKENDLSKEQQNEYLEHIGNSGSMLLKLIGDILDLSKIEEGKLTIHKEPFHFTETIQAALSPYRFKANEKGLEFSLLIDPYIPDTLIGDAHRINQILINLLGNALKFTKAGKISVSIAQTEPTVASNEDVWLRFTVQDTGIGIPLDKQKEIFEAFTQADSSIVKEFGGSGLGLAIVKQLVTLMGGTIETKRPLSRISEKGEMGSVFEFAIPLTRVKSINKEDAGLQHRSCVLKDLKILVVEDNLLNQKLAAHILSSFGCKAEIANNGREAVEKLLQDDYNLILMDVQMPVMDGYEATHLIRTKLNRSLPIIGLTANAFKEDKEACLNAGMDDHLNKPYSPEELKKYLIKWTKKQNTPLQAQ